MKKIIKESYELEEGDLELLRIPLPYNPCLVCADRYTGGCCGCPPMREYNKASQEYVTRGIYEIAVDLKTLTSWKEKIAEMSEEYDRVVNALPLVVQNKIVYGGKD